MDISVSEQLHLKVTWQVISEPSRQWEILCFPHYNQGLNEAMATGQFPSTQ